MHHGPLHEHEGPVESFQLFTTIDTPSIISYFTIGYMHHYW